MPHTMKGATMDHQPSILVGGDEARTWLGPEEKFPVDLVGLSLVELQVLHSRICRQLDHEYTAGFAGPHPWTLDRHRDLVAELDARCGSIPGVGP